MIKPSANSSASLKMSSENNKFAIAIPDGPVEQKKSGGTYGRPSKSSRIVFGRLQKLEHAYTCTVHINIVLKESMNDDDVLALNTFIYRQTELKPRSFNEFHTQNKVHRIHFLSRSTVPNDTCREVRHSQPKDVQEFLA